MKADTQTILVLHNKVITHNTRISVTHEEKKTWNLHIRQVKEEDRGCYMCQINTATMKKQVGCIDVHVPPNIIDNETSSDVNVGDGQSVSLVCTARGYPKPKITWRREDKDKIRIRTGRKERVKMAEVEGPVLNLTRINKRHMGAYLCIATNDVPPAVMKRINVNVKFAPTITVPEQLLGSPLGADLTIECHVEAFPKPITYWRKNNENMLLNGTKYMLTEETMSYHTVTRLLIRNLTDTDIGFYTCVAHNSIEQAEEKVQIYSIDLRTTRPPTLWGVGHEDTRTSAQGPGAVSSGLRKNSRDDAGGYPWASSADSSHSSIKRQHGLGTSRSGSGMDRGSSDFRDGGSSSSSAGAGRDFGATAGSGPSGRLLRLAPSTTSFLATNILPSQMVHNLLSLGFLSSSLVAHVVLTSSSLLLVCLFFVKWYTSLLNSSVA
ncbi:lachesin-like [Oratosquilla oratoria]|uniref:lachesin-like n=1 Tax=Oratosquilla oratoria TaxID=337810 RepID=UPI003F75E4AF